jgi:CubicO group peptidase (beta-lactamase class C family)
MATIDQLNGHARAKHSRSPFFVSVAIHLGPKENRLKPSLRLLLAALPALLVACSLNAQESNGLAPEITDFNAKDASYGLEKKIPYLKTAFIDVAPNDMKDGIPVGKLGVDGGNKKTILTFAQEIADSKHGVTDSLLISHKGKLIFESYYRRGRIDFPHYQMSITKSYTAMALGRAIQLGHFKMEDLDKPVVGFLKTLDTSKLAAGANKITLHEVMNMRSGIRLDKDKAKEVMKDRSKLKGQGQIQAYLQHSAPISKTSQTFKYQASDPAITMQVLEAVVPGSAKAFILKEVLGKMGIETYSWQSDLSGLPKSAAGSSMRSRDMLKWGMLVMNKGKWNGVQLIPADFVAQATGKVHTNKYGTSYGYFWWRADMKVGDKTYDCKSGRGAGGQFILMLEELDLIIVMTSHNKGMGKMLTITPKRLLPAFVE